MIIISEISCKIVYDVNIHRHIGIVSRTIDGSKNVGEKMCIFIKYFIVCSTNMIN